MMLGGLVVSSAIVMVEKMNIYRRKRGCNLLRVVIDTPKTYFSEVLMTSTTTFLGILPLILNPDETAVMWQTLGLTIFGGMLFSTFFVLLLVPLAYFGFEKVSDIILNYIKPKTNIFFSVYESINHKITRDFHRLNILC